MDRRPEKIPAGTLVVVADGHGARVFRNVGNDDHLLLRQCDLLEPQNVNDDAPSGVLPPEPGDGGIDEATFAKQLARHLNQGALQGSYAQLVLVADPQTLGQMRPQLHKEVQDRLIGEIAKDLTNTRLYDIERVLH